MSETFPEDESRCPDPIDNASMIEDKVRQHAVAIARSKAAPEQAQVKDKVTGILYWPVTECVDCDDPIPVARLAHARVRCVSCQTVLEQRKSPYA